MSTFIDFSRRHQGYTIPLNGVNVTGNNSGGDEDLYLISMRSNPCTTHIGYQTEVWYHIHTILVNDPSKTFHT